MKCIKNRSNQNTVNWGHAMTAHFKLLLFVGHKFITYSISSFQYFCFYCPAAILATRKFSPLFRKHAVDWKREYILLKYSSFFKQHI